MTPCCGMLLSALRALPYCWMPSVHSFHAPSMLTAQAPGLGR